MPRMRRLTSAPRPRPPAFASPRRPSPTSCATPGRATCGCAFLPRTAGLCFRCATTAPASTCKPRGAAARRARAWVWWAWKSARRWPAEPLSCAQCPDRVRYCWQHSRWTRARRKTNVDPLGTSRRPRARAGGHPLAPQRDAHVEVVGEAASGEEALEIASREQPDVVLMDIAMKGITGLEAAARMRDQLPGVRVIILSMHSGEEYVLQALRA